jgi:hypothetical protein
MSVLECSYISYRKPLERYLSFSFLYPFACSISDRFFFRPFKYSFTERSTVICHRRWTISVARSESGAKNIYIQQSVRSKHAILTRGNILLNHTCQYLGLGRPLFPLHNTKRVVLALPIDDVVNSET